MKRSVQVALYLGSAVAVAGYGAFMMRDCSVEAQPAASAAQPQRSCSGHSGHGGFGGFGRGSSETSRGGFGSTGHGSGGE